MEEMEQEEQEQHYYCYEHLQHDIDVEVDCTPDPRRCSLSSFMVRTPHTLCARRSHDMRTSLEHYDHGYSRQPHFANYVDDSAGSSNVEGNECTGETPQHRSVAPERVSNDLYHERTRHEQATEDAYRYRQPEHKVQELAVHKEHSHFATSSSETSLLPSHIYQPASSFAGLHSLSLQKEMSSSNKKCVNEMMNGSAHSTNDLWRCGINNNNNNNNYNERDAFHSLVQYVHRSKEEIPCFSSRMLEKEQERSPWSMEKAVTPSSRHCHQRGSDDWVPQRRFSPFMCNHLTFFKENKNTTTNNINNPANQDNTVNMKIMNEPSNGKDLHIKNNYYINTSSAVCANPSLQEEKQQLPQWNQWCPTLHICNSNFNMCSKVINEDVEEGKRDSSSSAFVDSPEQARHEEKSTLHECRHCSVRGKSLTPAQRDRCSSSSVYNTCSARGAESPSMFIMGRPTNLLFAKTTSTSKNHVNKTQETKMVNDSTNVVVNTFHDVVDTNVNFSLGEYNRTSTFCKMKNRYINENYDDDDDDDEEEILIARPDFAHSLSAANEPATTRNSPRLPLFVDMDEANMYRRSRYASITESICHHLNNNNNSNAGVGVSINCIATVSERPLPLQMESKCTNINTTETLFNLCADKLSEEEEENEELKEKHYNNTMKWHVRYSKSPSNKRNEENTSESSICNTVNDVNECGEHRRWSSKHLEMSFIEDAPRKPDRPSKKKESTAITKSSTELLLLSSFTTIDDGKEEIHEENVNCCNNKRVNDNEVNKNNSNNVQHEKKGRRNCTCRSLHEHNMSNDSKGLGTLEYEMELSGNKNDAFYTQEQVHDDFSKGNFRHKENYYITDNVEEGNKARNSYIEANEESREKVLNDEMTEKENTRDEIDNENWSYCTNSSVTYAKTLTKSFEMTEEFVHLQVEPSPTQKRLAFDECLYDNTIKSQATFKQEESAYHNECKTLNYVSDDHNSTQDVHNVCINGNSSSNKLCSSRTMQLREGHSPCLSSIDVNQLPESHSRQQKSKCKNAPYKDEAQQPFCKSGLHLLYSRKRYLDDAARSDVNDDDTDENKPALTFTESSEKGNVCAQRRPLQVIRHKRVCHECHYLPNSHKTTMSQTATTVTHNSTQKTQFWRLEWEHLCEIYQYEFFPPKQPPNN